jgi:hypothetical protein
VVQRRREKEKAQVRERARNISLQYTVWESIIIEQKMEASSKQNTAHNGLLTATNLVNPE